MCGFHSQWSELGWGSVSNQNDERGETTKNSAEYFFIFFMH